jgi:hypothetical protein
MSGEGFVRVEDLTVVTLQSNNKHIFTNGLVGCTSPVFNSSKFLMEEARFTETSVNIHPITWCHITRRQ